MVRQATGPGQPHGPAPTIAAMRLLRTAPARLAALPPARRAALARLVAMAIVVGAAAGAAALLLPHSPPALGDALSGTGAIGLLVAVAAWAALTPLLVSGTVLAIAAGLVFGPVWGSAVGIAGSTLGAVTSFAIASRGGRGAVGALAGPRLERLLARLERRGFVAVVLARLAPGVPVTLLNYAAGLTRMRVLAFAAGIAIGGAPRTIAYAAIGGTRGDLSSPAGVVALALLAGLGAAALLAAGLRMRAARRAAPAGA